MCQIQTPVLKWTSPPVSSYLTVFPEGDLSVTYSGALYEAARAWNPFGRGAARDPPGLLETAAPFTALQSPHCDRATLGILPHSKDSRHRMAADDGRPPHRRRVGAQVCFSLKVAAGQETKKKDASGYDAAFATRALTKSIWHSGLG